MAFYHLTDTEVKTLNDWARTQPSLRGVFPYTDGRPGLGDRLNFVDFTDDINTFTNITVKETDGNPPDFSTDTITFASDSFYLEADSAGKPVVNFRGTIGTSSSTNIASITASWNFNNSTVSANPGNKKFGLNTSDLGTATNIFINDTTVSGFDIGTLAGFLTTGNRIYIQEADDSTRAVLYSVTGSATDNGGWWTIPVTSIANSGSLFQNNGECVFIFGFNPASVTDHGALTGLLDDDHPQYLLINGTRSMTGNLDMGGHDVANAHAGTFSDRILAEAFYVSGGTRPPSLDSVGLLVDQIEGYGDQSSTSLSRIINIPSPVIYTPASIYSGNYAGSASGAQQMLILGTMNCTGQNQILANAVLDATTFDNIDTSQGFSNMPTFQSNTKFIDKNTGSAHTFLWCTGFSAANELRIGSNGAKTAWSGGGNTVNGFVSVPAVLRNTGVTTGTLTVAQMAAFASNRSLGGFRGVVGPQQVGTGATVTDYVHYYAGSGGSDEMVIGGTITNEYGIKLNNISKGLNRFSLWSDSATASMRHAGKVRIGDTNPPGYTLDVNGRANITGVLGVTALNADPAFYLQGGMIVTSGTQLQSTLRVDGISTFGSQLRLNVNATEGNPSLTWAQFPTAPGFFPLKTGTTIDGFGFTDGVQTVFTIGRDGTWSKEKSKAESFYLRNGDISNEVPSAVAIGGTTVAFMPPRLTTTQRDALSASNGMIIYNTSLNKFQGFEGGAWTNLI